MRFELRRIAPIACLAATLMACAADASREARTPPALAELEPAAGPPGPSPEWPSAPGCAATIEAVLGAHRAGRLPATPAGAPVGLLLVDADGATLRVERDLALPVASGLAPPVPCLVVVGLPPGFAETRIRSLGERSVLSEYPGATRRRTNPDYEEARRELRELREESEGAVGSLDATGDTTLDLVGLAAGGLIQAIGGWYDARRLEAARARLEATPRYLEEPSWRTYRLSVEDVVVERSLRLRMGLVDRSAGRVRTGVRRARFEDRQAIADGLHPRDREVAEGRVAYRTRAEIEALVDQPVTVAASALLRWALEAGGDAAWRPGSVASVLAEFEHEPAPAVAAGSAGPVRADPPAAAGAAPAAAGHAGLVAVVGASGSGQGFFVGAHEVVTAHALMGDSSLVELRWPDGFTSWGVLVGDDPASGLALVHVPKSGEALAIAESTKTTGGGAWPTAPPGTPLLQDGAVVSVAVGGGARVVLSVTLSAFLARMRRL